MSKSVKQDIELEISVNLEIQAETKMLASITAYNIQSICEKHNDELRQEVGKAVNRFLKKHKVL